MIDKSSASITEVLSHIKDGSTIMIGGFAPQDNLPNSLMACWIWASKT
jgi:acyl CoA:acetate/3-ketoacid CoA transferase alpha subunit